SFCCFFRAEDGIRVFHVTGVQTCALPICLSRSSSVRVASSSATSASGSAASSSAGRTRAMAWRANTRKTSSEASRVTVSSSESTTVPYRPPMVMTRAPASTLFCMSCCSRWRFFCGRIMTKYIRTMKPTIMIRKSRLLPPAASSCARTSAAESTAVPFVVGGHLRRGRSLSRAHRVRFAPPAPSARPRGTGGAWLPLAVPTLRGAAPEQPFGGRRLQAEVPPARGGGDAAAGGAGQESGAHQVGLADLLDGVGLLPHGHGQGRQAHRAAAERLDQGAEDGPVEAVEAEVVHVVEG